MAFLRKTLWSLFIVGPTIAVVIWASEQPLIATYAAMSLEEVAVDPDDLKQPAQLRQLKRQIQRHFLDHQIYIPLSDMTFRDYGWDGRTKLKQGLAKLCGRGIMFVWVPLRFKLPFWGEQILEWCWKPDIRRTAGRLNRP